MKNIHWLDDLKIRGSYGELGNQSNVSGSNAYTLFGSDVSSSYYNMSGAITGDSEQGFYQTRYGNSNTSWERDIIYNLGIDATFLKSKIGFSAEYYQKSIKGLLFTQPTLATAGGGTPPSVNIGDIQNTGFDILANYRGRIGSDLNFKIGANITSYKNEVISIPGSAGYFDTAGSRMGNLIRNQEGHAVSEFFGYEVIGLFQSAEDVANSPTQQGAGAGQFKYRDVTEDGEITTDDRTFIGNPNPNFTYGVNLDLSYKNFDLSAVFYGSHGNEVCNHLKWYSYFTSYYHNGLSRDLLNAWTLENPNSTVPVFMGASSFSENGVPNSWYIEDGSFLKLRSLVLGYTFPPYILERLKIKKIRVYLQATNLFQITSYSGLDPEVKGSSSNFGRDLGNYPNNQREYLVGLNVSF